MDKQIGSEYKGPQLVTYLKDNADTQEERAYMKQFSPEAIVEMKSELAEVSIKINDISHEKKAIMSEFKVRETPFVVAKHTLLTNIKLKAEFVTETCYKMVDRKARVTGYYNSLGILVDERAATMDELQGVIEFSKTGTNE